MNRTIRSFVALALLTPAAASADDLYFAEIEPGFLSGYVSRIGTDGTGYTRLLETGSGIRAVAIDGIEGKVYWTDVNNYVIARANLDGSNPENVVTSGLIFPAAITIDPVARTMYWLDQDNWLARSGLDGSGFEVLSETVTHRGIALDGAGKVYWSTSDTMLRGKILRANLDGSQVQVVVSSQDSEFKPSALALDVAGGKIYWTDYVVDVVRRSNLDGSDIEIIWAAGANHNPRGIALDLANGKVYWGQDNDFDGTSARIMRANLDGTEAEIVINNIGLPNYLAFVPEGSECAADFDGDGFVTGIDFDLFVTAFEAGDSAADFDGDGFITGIDYDLYVAAYEAGCP